MALKSMGKLRDVLVEALEGMDNSRNAFLSICFALVDYQKEYPDFFDRTLNYIHIDTSEADNSLLNQTYKIGEEINLIIEKYLESGIQKGELCACENYVETIFHMWGMISGIIKLANEKEEYMELAGNISKEKFLKDGFMKIYSILCQTGE